MKRVLVAEQILGQLYFTAAAVVFCHESLFERVDSWTSRSISDPNVPFFLSRIAPPRPPGSRFNAYRPPAVYYGLPPSHTGASTGLRMAKPGLFKM